MMSIIRWMPNIDDFRRFGNDVSRYQGFLDYEVYDDFDLPVSEFIAVCSGISWGYQDKLFPHHWAGAKSINRPRILYHILYPLEPPTRQADNMLRIAGDDLGEGPPVWDVELIHGATRAQITDATLSVLTETERIAGIRPIVYTRPYFVRDHMIPNADWYDEYLWWMATYLISGKEARYQHLVDTMNRAGIGIPIENVIFQQTSERGWASKFGATDCYNIDYDRFCGTQEQWDEFWNITPPQPQPSYPIDVSETERKSVFSLYDKLRD